MPGPPTNPANPIVFLDIKIGRENGNVDVISKQHSADNKNNFLAQSVE